jgi:hypothetical protein
MFQLSSLPYGIASLIRRVQSLFQVFDADAGALNISVTQGEWRLFSDTLRGDGIESLT